MGSETWLEPRWLGMFCEPGIAAVSLWRTGVLIAGVGTVACRVAGSDGFVLVVGWVLTGFSSVGCGPGLGLLCTVVTAAIALLGAVGASAGEGAWISSIRLKRRAPGSGGFHFGLDAACPVSVVACRNSGVSSGKLKGGIACPLVKVRLESEPPEGWVA